MAITRGELRAGDRITELGLAKQLGVSQPTIREALIELEHKGFIERRGPRKTFVTRLSRRDINDMYAVRMQLEALALELLVRAGRKRLPESETSYQRMVKAAQAGNAEEFFRADVDFHRGLWRAAGNRTIIEMMELLLPKQFAFAQVQWKNPTPESLLVTAEEHAKLLACLRAGDGQSAKATMEASLRRGLLEDTEAS